MGLGVERLDEAHDITTIEVRLAKLMDYFCQAKLNHSRGLKKLGQPGRKKCIAIRKAVTCTDASQYTMVVDFLIRFLFVNDAFHGSFKLSKHFGARGERE